MSMLLAILAASLLPPNAAPAGVATEIRSAFGCGFFKMDHGKVLAGARAQHLSFVMPGRLAASFDPTKIMIFDPAGMLEGNAFAELKSDAKDRPQEKYTFWAGKLGEPYPAILLLNKALAQKPENGIQYDASIMVFSDPLSPNEKNFYRGICSYHEDPTIVGQLEAERIKASKQ